MFSGANKITGVRVLMLISQVLLLVFLVKWLTVQYRSEKDILKKDLEHLYVQATDNATDSLLLRRFIEPLLRDEKLSKRIVIKDSAFSVVSDDNISDSFLVRYQSMEKEFATKVSSAHKIIRVKTLSTRGDTISGTFAPGKHREDSALSDITKMMKGVRILVNRIQDDSFSRANVDDAEVMGSLEWQMRVNGYPFKIEKQKGKSVDKGILLKNPLRINSGVVITGYKGYLLRKIAPDSCFALLLLSITTAAFITMYRSLRSQQKLNIMKSDLVSNMTHELKTPIATVKVALEALDSFQVIRDPDTTREYLQMAVSEMNRLELLVNQALNTSLLETGSMKLQLEKENMADLTKQTVDALQLKFQQKQATVTVNITGQNFIAAVDRLHFQGVLINLLDNSLKYGLNDPVITATVCDEGNNVTVTVSDNGPGIPTRYHERVFDKFFRVPTGNVHDVSGYGLGLSYAKQVMEQHHGSIAVKNNESEGCSFILTLNKAEA